MDTIFRPKGLRVLDEEIKRLVNQLKCMNPVEDDYVKIANNLKVLTEAREKKNSSDVSTEMLIAVGANILGLLIILNFEKTGVITSKAFNLLWKK